MGEDLIGIELPARVWAGIDGDIDNAISNAAVAGDEVVERTGRVIRQAGWDQVPWVDGQWPPLDQQITITLRRSQWDFAMGHVRSSMAVYDELADAESAGLCREALALVLPRLA